MQLHIWSNSNDPTPRVGVQHYKSDRGGGEYLASMLTLFDQKCWSLNSILLSKLLGSVWWKEGREKVTAVVQPEEMERERNTCNREIVQRRTPQGRKRQVGQRRAAALWHPVCAPPPPSRLHYDSFSVRVKVRPDSSAAVYGYVCFFCVYVCSRGCFAAPIQNRWGGDGNEESQTENQTERFIGGKWESLLRRWGWAAPWGFGWKSQINPSCMAGGLIPS